MDFERQGGAELEETAAGILDAADRRAAVASGAGIDHVAVGLGLEIEAGPGAREDGAQVVGALLLLAGLEGAVEELAVVVHGGGDIERGFLAAFDLERGHPGAGEIVDGRAAGEVLHRKNEPARVLTMFINMVNSGGGVENGFERVAAGVGAGAAVAGAVAQQGGIEAQAGIRIAQGAVQEGLDLGGGLLGDAADFVEGEFAREGDAPEAQPRGGADAFEVVEGHLRGGVQAQGGEMPPRQPRHAEILHDDRVDAAVGAQAEGADEIGQFGVADQRVEGDVDAARTRQRMGIDRDFLEFAGREVDGLGAGGEARQAGVDGVGAEGERGIGGSAFPRGGEQFGRPGGGTHGGSCASARSAASVSRAMQAAAVAASGKGWWPRRRRVKATSTARS